MSQDNGFLGSGPYPSHLLTAHPRGRIYSPTVDPILFLSASSPRKGTLKFLNGLNLTYHLCHSESSAPFFSEIQFYHGAYKPIVWKHILKCIKKLGKNNICIRTLYVHTQVFLGKTIFLSPCKIEFFLCSNRNIAGHLFVFFKQILFSWKHVHKYSMYGCTHIIFFIFLIF
jgi:hypothetical protein